MCKFFAKCGLLDTFYDILENFKNNWKLDMRGFKDFGRWRKSKMYGNISIISWLVCHDNSLNSDQSMVFTTEIQNDLKLNSLLHCELTKVS